jgi:hypothetical protein
MNLVCWLVFVFVPNNRVLVPEGKYVQISFGQPHFRKRNYFANDKYGWTVTDQTFGAGFGYFLYTMKKGTPLPDNIDDDINTNNDAAPATATATSASGEENKSNNTPTTTTTGSNVATNERPS